MFSLYIIGIFCLYIIGIFCLSLGANLVSQNQEGETPLLLAEYGNHDEVSLSSVIHSLCII